MGLKALMVDVDGVIVVHPDPKGWSANLERDLGLSARTLQEKFFKPYFADIVHGRAGLHERLAPVLAEIAPQVSVDALVSYWFANDACLNTDLLVQLAEMRSRGVELHLATVQEHKRARYLWNTLRLREQFDRMHYAADLGWAKPALQFYAEIEARTGFRGDDIFFIDDRDENVESARVRGWRAAVWTGRQSLFDVMRKAGVLPGPVEGVVRKPDPVFVADYDPEWPAKFERLRARLAEALGDVATDIAHVGSTSVPGLAAKPTIDILVLLSSAERLPLAIQRLAAIGYAHEGDLGIKSREAFANPPGTAVHDHHLYVCPPDSTSYRDQVAFRNYLRANAGAARAYGDLKRDLAARFRNDRARYRQAKTEFVLEALRQAVSRQN